MPVAPADDANWPMVSTSQPVTTFALIPSAVPVVAVPPTRFTEQVETLRAEMPVALPASLAPKPMEVTRQPETEVRPEIPVLLIAPPTVDTEQFVTTLALMPIAPRPELAMELTVHETTVRAMIPVKVCGSEQPDTTIPPPGRKCSTPRCRSRRWRSNRNRARGYPRP